MICSCAHWLEDHPGHGPCEAEDCNCDGFDYDGGVWSRPKVQMETAAQPAVRQGVDEA